MTLSLPPVPPADSPAPPREQGFTAHRRETRTQLILPFVGALLIVLALTAVPLLLNDPQARLRVSFVADLLMTICILCPAVVCFAVIYFVVVLGIFGMGVLHRMAGTPLERLERITARFATGIDGVTRRVNEKAIAWSASLAPVYRVLSWFDRDSEA